MLSLSWFSGSSCFTVKFKCQATSIAEAWSIRRSHALFRVSIQVCRSLVVALAPAAIGIIIGKPKDDWLAPISYLIMFCLVCPVLSFLSGLALPCFILSYLILSYPTISCDLIAYVILSYSSYLFLSYRILSYLILSYFSLSYYILFHLILSYDILSYPVLFSLIVSYLILFHLIIFHLIVSYRILRCAHVKRGL